MSSDNTYGGWLWAVLMGFDQLGNAICGGHPDVSISARLGRASVRQDGWLMQALAHVVDFAFMPVEAKHCFRSWWVENHSSSKVRRGNDVGFVMMVPIILTFTPTLFLVNCLRWLVRRFR